MDPVALGIPHYRDLVKQPMDLSSIRKKLDLNEYDAMADFEADVRLMLNNCFLFNPAHDPVHMMGRKVEAWFEEKLGERPPFSPPHHLQTSPSRRHSKSGDYDSEDEDSAEEGLPHPCDSHYFLVLLLRVDKQRQINNLEQQMKLLQQQLQHVQQPPRRRKDGKKVHGSSNRLSSNSHHALLSGSGEKSRSKPSKSSSHHHRSSPPEVREISFDEKRLLSEAINSLSGDRLSRVVEIIRAGMPQLVGVCGAADST